MINKTIFKTTDEILQSHWNDQEFRVSTTPSNLTVLPPRQQGLYLYNLTVEDIRMWETLYYEGGNIGIYGAWDPYSEFFIITYNLFLDSPAGIEVFSGSGAIRRLHAKAKELGVDLEISEIWVESENVKYYDHFN